MTSIYSHSGLPFNFGISLRGREGKEKGIFGAIETRGAHEEGERETPAKRPLFFTLYTSNKRMLKSWLVSLQTLPPCAPLEFLSRPKSARTPATQVTSALAEGIESKSYQQINFIL